MHKFDNYNMDEKPVVDVPSTEDPVFQGGHDLGPVTKPVAPKSKYSKKVMPKNNVSKAASNKLQKASRLSGKVKSGSNHSRLSG